MALSEIIASSFEEHYRLVRQRIHELVGPLSAEQLWERPYPYGNSIGHLLLHITGNLNYYIGSQIAQSGYVRDRDLEFTSPEKRSKQDVLADFDAAFDLVFVALRAQSEEDWGRAYAAERDAISKDRLGVFLRCASHANNHLGQMIYLKAEMALANPVNQVER